MASIRPKTPKPFGNSSSAAIAVVKALSFLDPNSIKKDMLATNKHLFSDYPIGMNMLMDALRELETSKFFSSSTNETLSFNANMPENVRNMLGDTEWTSIFRGVVSLLSASWPFTDVRNRNITARWATYEIYIPHCAQLRNLLQEKWMVEEEFDAGIEAAKLFNDAAWYMCEIAAHDEIERYARASLKVLENIAPNDQPELERQTKDIHISSELGISISGQGTGDAAKAFRHADKALKIVKELEDLDPGTDSLPRAICYNNMAIAQNLLGLTYDSIETWKVSLKYFSKSRGSVTLDKTWPVVNSALEYCHRGEARKASNLTALQREMERARPSRDPLVLEDGRVWEGDKLRDDLTSSDTGAILRALGHMYAGLGSPYLALHFHKRALRNLRATLGNNHFRTADCMYNAAQDYLKLEPEGHNRIIPSRVPRREGDFRDHDSEEEVDREEEAERDRKEEAEREEEAERDRKVRAERNKRDAMKLLDEAIAVWGDNPWYEKSAARALWRKGRLLLEDGKAAEAKDYLRKAMEIRRVIAPDDKRDEKELEEKDWTDLIYFYSR